jgi:ribonuclease HI
MPYFRFYKRLDWMRTINIYTDGSHKRHENSLRIGAYCSYKKIEASLSRECTPELLAKYDIADTCCSNPTAEYLAFAEVLHMFARKRLVEDITLCFHVDYIGVIHWTDETWAAKKTYIQKIRDIVKKDIDKLEHRGISVEIKHVKGHSGVFGNEMADQLAGNKENINTFPPFILTFQQKGG